MRPFVEAIRPLIPLLSLFVITSIWTIYSTSDIISRNPRILFLLFGIVFSNISVIFYLSIQYFENNSKILFYFQCRLIVAQMSDTRADCWNHLMWLILVLGGFSVIPKNWLNLSSHVVIEIENALLYVITIVTLMIHTHYGFGVV